jgi:predicted XRE-type DNA-binding protein
MAEIEKGSGNVYADLEFPDANKMFVKAQLVAKIENSSKQRKLPQQQAANIMDMTLSRVSKMRRGHFHDISEAKMLDCLRWPSATGGGLGSCRFRLRYARPADPSHRRSGTR